MIKPIALDDPPPPTTRDGDRELTREEIEKYVAPIYKEAGQSLPDPSCSTFIGAVEKGEVVAFLGLEVKLHGEPLWIKDGNANRLFGLIRKAEELILERCGPQWIYLHAPAGRVARLAQLMGMQLEPWVVLTKLIAPAAPKKLPIDLTSMDEPIDGIVN